MKHPCRWLVLLGCILLLPGSARAQADRHELGLRLRALEAAWTEHPDEKARARALPHIQRAVAVFFGFNLGDAGKSLDLARFQLRAAEAPPPAVRWAESLQVRMNCALVDTADASVGLVLSAFYAVEGELPAQAKLRVTVRTGAGKLLPPALVVPIAALPLEDKLSLQGIVEGDHQLRAEILVGDQVLCSHEQGLSAVSKRDARLAVLKKALAEVPEEAARLDRESARGLLRVLQALADKQTLETSYPAARLLREAESVVQALTGGKSWYGQRRPGQFWLALPAGKGTTTARLLAPTAVERGTPLPLVIALHGAGGSENMFFDGYGRGAIVEMCQKRGWLLLAPRSPLFGGAPPVAELIEEVARLYPVERKQVFLVGHSMGAAQAVGAVSLTPERFAGVAALGGGGAPKASEGLKKVPFFVGVGREDFALAGSRALNDRLTKAGVEQVRYREFAGIEHLMIVQTTLPEVFAWFDERLK